MTHTHADLVVVGGGGAGLAAAITAHDCGLERVIVVEKRKNVGGNAAMSGGFLFAVTSRPQREAGLANSPDAVFRETLDYFHYDGVDPRLLRLWVDGADETVRWLEDHGVGYRCVPGMALGVEPSGWSNPPGSFRRVINELAHQFEQAGGQIITGAVPAHISRKPGGSVAGIVIDGPGGQMQIATDRVLLATGGFTGNIELLERHFGDIYREDVYWTDSKRHAGDGIALASEVGACVDGPTFLIKENGYSFTTKKNMPNRAAMEGSSLWVNRRGERFLDESLGTVNATTNALIAQPGMVGFALFDDVLIQQVMDRPDPFADDLRPGEQDPSTWTAEGYRHTLRETLADESNGAWSVARSDWSEIAAWIGADPEVLRATVDEYNGFCDAGRDGLLAKDAALLQALRRPPFYALKFRPLMIDTCGPLRVDERMRVLDDQRRPIPGLFAAGSLVSGWIGFDEHRFGTPLSWAITSGRRAAEVAAGRLAPVEASRS